MPPKGAAPTGVAEAATPAPVLVFFYGGGWMSGSKEMYRFVGAAIFQIGVNRQIGCLSDRPAVLDDGIPAHCRVAERICKAQTGGRQGLKSQGGKKLCRSCVPGVRDDEGTRPLMQRAKQFRFFQLGAHR